METLPETEEEHHEEEREEEEPETDRGGTSETNGEDGEEADGEAEGEGDQGGGDGGSAGRVAAPGAAATLGVDKDTAGSTDEGPSRLFRSGKGPAEQAYELFQKEMSEWKLKQDEEAAKQKLKHRGGHKGRGKATNLATLDLDSSGSDTDLEDAADTARNSWTGLTNGLTKLYEKACATYQVTALTQFKLQLTSKCLAITNMSLRHRDVAAMCIPLAHKDDLTYIDFSGNLIGLKGLTSLLRVAKEFHQLTNLDLSNNSLGSEAAQLLASKADNLRTLRMLKLSGNGFLEKDAESIATLIAQLDGLRTLNVSSNTFGSHGGELIGAALKTNANLESLNLSCCEIRMQGAVAIGMALKDNGALDSLDVSFNGFSDLGAKAIAEALKTNAALTVLNLTSNRIFIDGARAIGAMLGVNETLKELYLDKNSFTCEGAQEILAMLKGNENTALKILDMKNVSITYKTAAAALPTVQQPLLVRFESFVVEPGSIREQLGIPYGAGGSVTLTQKLQAEAAHVLRVFTHTQRLNLVRLAKEASKGHGGDGGGEGLTESEMRRLLLSLPIGLLDDEVESLIDSIRGEPSEDGSYTFTLNSLLTLGQPQLGKFEMQH